MNHFRQLLERLKRDHRTRYPVRVYIVPGLADLGECDLKETASGKWFKISVRKDRADVMLHTLIEEYSHAMAWFVEKKDHDEQWAKRYSTLRIWWESPQ